MGLYASQSYVQNFGRPDSPADFYKHRFVGPENLDHRAPFYRWLTGHAPADRIIYRSSEPEAIEQAILNGLGIGFLRTWEARQNRNLVEIMPSIPDWDSPLWIVTHVDLHRTLKVQTFLTALKEQAQDWVCR
jgi:DNA-binding transcriptional LysR family regulator